MNCRKSEAETVCATEFKSKLIDVTVVLEAIDLETEGPRNVPHTASDVNLIPKSVEYAKIV